MTFVAANDYDAIYRVNNSDGVQPQQEYVHAAEAERVHNCFLRTIQWIVPLSGGEVLDHYEIDGCRIAVRDILAAIVLNVVLASTTSHKTENGYDNGPGIGIAIAFAASVVLNITDFALAKRNLRRVVIRECLEAPHPRHQAMDKAVSKSSISGTDFLDAFLHSIPPGQRAQVLNKRSSEGHSFLSVCWSKKRRDKLVACGADPFYVPPGGVSDMQRAVVHNSEFRIKEYAEHLSRELTEDEQVELTLCLRTASTARCLFEHLNLNPNAVKGEQSLVVHLAESADVPLSCVRQLIRLGANGAPLKELLSGDRGVKEMAFKKFGINQNGGDV